MSDALSRLQAGLAGRYRVERELGRGGAATVYLARDLKHDRLVAIKVLHPELAAALGAERFLREIQLTARLQHPHILPLLDSGSAELGGGAVALYYVMPYAAGETLRALLRQERQLPLVDTLRIAGNVAAALAEAHAEGIVHRDIKPENILLARGEAMVADFGIARAIDAAAEGHLTATGLAIGTPAYMSPEQAGGQRDLDGRSDVYSLGCVLFEMLAGEPPHAGPTPQAIVARRLHEPVPRLRTIRPTIPPQVDRVLARALAVVPADRYHSAADFEAALTAAAAVAARAGEDHAPEQASRKRRPSGRWIGLGLILTGLLVGALWFRFASRPSGARPLAVRPNSIAVLPLVNASPDSANEYFSDGMTEELIRVLGKVPGLRVAARSSTFAFKDRDQDAREIGEQLGVGSVLEGSVRQAGDRLRVTVHLVSVREGFDLWSETYERPITDIFAVQDEISQAVMSALRGRLLGEDRLAVTPTPRSLAAHTAYLKGRYYYRTFVPANTARAIALFQEAIGEDSAYALAWAGLADAYTQQFILEAGRAQDIMPRARSAADRALALDSTLAEAHTSLGFIRFLYDWDWPAAEAALRRAIALNPNLLQAYHWYSHLLLALGRVEESEAASRQALELSPIDPTMIAHLGWHYLYSRQYAKAREALARALEIDSTSGGTYIWRGQLAEFTGDYPAARTELRQALRFSPGRIEYQAELARVAALEGHPEEARAILQRLVASSQDHYVSPHTIALVQLALGNSQETFRLLARAVEDRSEYLVYLKMDPRLDTVRNDPRFARLVRRVGLP